MNTRYIIPFGVLAVSLTLLVLWAMDVGGSLRQERDELANSADALHQARTASTALTTLLVKAKMDASPANTFMNHWRDILSGSHDSNGILTDMAKFATNETVAVQGRKSGSVEYLWEGKPVQVQFAESTGVSSEFYRVLNWLGDIEKTWPIARVEQMDFQQTGPSLQLLIRLTVPTFIAESAK